MLISITSTRWHAFASCTVIARPKIKAILIKLSLQRVGKK